MIGTSLLEYIFIRACIIGLQSVAPLSILCCLIWSVSHAVGLRGPLYTPWPFKTWVVAEAVFYVFVNVIYREKLQCGALHPPAPPRRERKKLFDLCNNNIRDPEAYLNKWFLGAPPNEIKRDNVKEFFLWALFNRGGPSGEDDEEVEEYVAATEILLGRKIEQGRGSAVCLRLTIDGVSMSHRSILWYICVAFVDCLTCLRLFFYGFLFRRTAFPHFFMILPLRPLILFPASRSPAKKLTYWYRPHNSRTRRPIVFIHGIGIGLYPYVNFLAQLDSRLNRGKTSEDQVGIIAIEIMPVSFRITHSALTKDEMCDEIQTILTHHRFDRPVLVSHSYGTIITTQLLRSPTMTHQIGPIVLIDPISIMLHLPDVAYNFTRRKPRRANEHQLYYFASMDMGVSHSLSRCFFWSENVLWKHDIGDHLLTVSLAEQDLIVDTKAVGSYLARQHDEVATRKEQCIGSTSNGDIGYAVVSKSGQGSTTLHQGSNGRPQDNQVSQRRSRTLNNSSGDDDDVAGWKSQRWLGKGLDLIWFPTLDHAQVFDTAQTRKPLIDAISQYSTQRY